MVIHVFLQESDSDWSGPNIVNVLSCNVCTKKELIDELKKADINNFQVSEVEDRYIEIKGLMK